MELRFANRRGAMAASTPFHLYFLPHPALRPYIAHYTLCLDAGITPPDAHPLLTLIPDVSGCLVLEPGEEGFYSALMFGPSTRVVRVENDLGRFRARLFVEFRPGGLYALTGLPQWEVRDQRFPLGEAAPALYALALEALRGAADLDELVDRLDLALCARPVFASTVGPMLHHLVGIQDALPVRALAQETAYSQRHLSRLFHQGAGVGCKSFLRVVRINAAVRRLQAGAHSLTALSQELGYYDQAHFIHDFRSVCAVTPAQYRASLSDFYNEPLKL